LMVECHSYVYEALQDVYFCVLPAK
jgi:hypothetical protein